MQYDRMPQRRMSEDKKRHANAIRQTRFRVKKRAEAIAANRKQAHEAAPANQEPVMNENLRGVDDITDAVQQNDQSDLRWRKSLLEKILKTVLLTHFEDYTKRMGRPISP